MFHTKHNLPIEKAPENIYALISFQTFYKGWSQKAHQSVHNTLYFKNTTN